MKGLTLQLCEEALFYLAQNSTAHSLIRKLNIQSQCVTDLKEANQHPCLWLDDNAIIRKCHTHQN